MTPEEAEFLGTVVTVARTIPRDLLDNFCERLEQLPSEAVQSDRLSLAMTIVQTKARDTLSRLLVLWCDKAPNLSPPSLAWALRAACRADKFHRTWQSLELVWTGPAPVFSSLRRTEQALLDLIQGAQRSVFIVTFAAYKIPEIVTALTKATQRGVAVSLIIESAEESGGKTAFETVDAMGEQLRNEAVIYVWPLEQRPRDTAGRYGSLHVKCAVADDIVALISSANLTEFALNLNMELGVLIRGGDIPPQITTHLRRLIEKGVLIPVLHSVV